MAMHLSGSLSRLCRRQPPPVPSRLPRPSPQPPSTPFSHKDHLPGHLAPASIWIWVQLSPVAQSGISNMPIPMETTFFCRVRLPGWLLLVRQRHPHPTVRSRYLAIPALFMLNSLAVSIFVTAQMITASAGCTCLVLIPPARPSTSNSSPGPHPEIKTKEER